MRATSPHSVDVHVGMRVRARRRQLGVSQIALAERVGVTYQQIQKYERGTNRISVSKLFEIAGALSSPPGWFFDGLPSHIDDPQEGHVDILASFIGTDEGAEIARIWHGLNAKRRKAVLAVLVAMDRTP